MKTQRFKRTISCVYFLYHHGDVVYIGQTEKIWRRITEHISEGRIRFDEWSFVPVHWQRRDTEEARLIELYRPRYNRVRNDKAGCRYRYTAPRKLRGIPVWNCTTKAWPLEE